MPILGIIQLVGYFHVSRTLLGVFEVTFMGDPYNLYSKDSGFILSMCLRNFGSIILRVWLKL